MLYDITILQFQKTLENLREILAKAATQASAKQLDIEALLQARLASDQFPLMRQLQIACDTAKLGASRVTGKEAPTHADTEKTVAELQSRIESVVTYLGTFSAADFDDVAERRVSQPRWEGKYLTANEFAIQHMIPNFYFHATTAYAILRHNGIDVGKKDYLGALPFKEPS